MPQAPGPVPAVVLASAVHGVDKDLRDLADEFASHGFIAAAPDLFWRTIPGPLTRADGELTGKRSQPRPEKIKTGEADIADTLDMLRKLPEFNGRAAVMGFCYGGPYAIIGPKRLGYAAGISCHGTRMQDYIGELDGLTAPICIIWGDEDNQAPPDVLEAYRKVPPAHEQCGAAHFSRRQACLHDAGCRRRLQHADARFFHGARARHPRRFAWRRRETAQGVVNHWAA